MLQPSILDGAAACTCRWQRNSGRGKVTNKCTYYSQEVNRTQKKKKGHLLDIIITAGNTSSPALATFPDSSASIRASSSTMAPREVLTLRHCPSSARTPCVWASQSLRPGDSLMDTMPDTNRSSSSDGRYVASYCTFSSGESRVRLWCLILRTNTASFLATCWIYQRGPRRAPRRTVCRDVYPCARGSRPRALWLLAISSATSAIIRPLRQVDSRTCEGFFI